MGVHVQRRKWKSKNGRTYESILLRHSYRKDGKVQKRTVANLTHCPPQDVAAIELALKHKKNLATLVSLEGVELTQGVSVGAVWVAYQVARRLGIDKALGTDFAGKLAMWQVIARLIEQGSRLSAVRLARGHAAADVLLLSRGFDENDLYENLTWLAGEQEEVERRLFAYRQGGAQPELFLYDVTSSYLEGTKNELGAFGYNRDGKKGKLQIVIGLLCDESGQPISAEVFKGNTQDPATFGPQVKKVAQRFGCQRVTMVGDRGMIKRGQIEDLVEAGFHYITAITKPQIRTLIKKGIMDMSLFDETVCEVISDSVRYVLRRNPQRAEELAATRRSKRCKIEELIEHRNAYLKNHSRAKTATAVKTVQDKIVRLKSDAWLSVAVDDRLLHLREDEESLSEVSRLDGCYVIKTDLPLDVADKQVIHDRYKDLAHVEWAFRTSKTTHLEIRPVYVRKAANTRGHVLIVMLAYMVARALRIAWSKLDVTVEEGLEQLKTVCSMQLKTTAGGCCLRIPQPSEQVGQLLDVLDLHLPEALPHVDVNVDTRKKLQNQRKS